ncbi:hypothetical protein LguiA_015720 [Lonicera macranthoides]
MAEKEQEKPLAPAYTRTPTHFLSTELKNHRPRHRKFLLCGCIAAVLLIIVVVILVLSFTVFHIKDPVMNLNAVQIQGLEFINATNILSDPTTNITVLADVSVKNPNVATFKYNEATTRLYYDGVLVGEARTPPGRAMARRTVRLNVTIDVMVNRLVAVPGLGSDLNAGALPVRSYSSISGRVKILNVKKNVAVKMNCTMIVNVTSRSIQDQNCKPHVST